MQIIDSDVAAKYGRFVLGEAVCSVDCTSSAWPASVIVLQDFLQLLLALLERFQVILSVKVLAKSQSVPLTLKVYDAQIMIFYSRSQEEFNVHNVLYYSVLYSSF